MKINVTNILLSLLVVILLFNMFSKEDPVEPQPVIVTIPETNGTVVDTIEVIKRDTVYLQGKKEYIQVDAGWKEKYEQAKDSLEKQQIFLESIKINEYEKTLVDNDTIEIKGKATTRGSLLDFNVDYRIKPIDFSYTPEIVTKRPSLSVGLGVEGGVPTVPNTNFLLKGNLSLENGKGNGLNLGYDTENRIWLGVSKTFKLIK